MEPLVKKPRDKCNNICAVKGCKVTSQTANASLFRFPKDLERCKQWIEVCGSQYLLHSMASLYNSYYRVCNAHFPEEMLVRSIKDGGMRLASNSIPTLNLPQAQSISTSSVSLDDTHVKILNTNMKVEPTMSEVQTEKIIINEPGTSGLQHQATLYLSNIPDSMNSTAAVKENLNAATQTVKQFSGHTPRKEKLRKKVRKFKTESNVLKKKLEVTKRSGSVVDNLTLEEFKVSCDKFLSPECASFVKLQADLNEKEPHQRRYSREFLYMCLKSYFMSPRAYRSLSELFTLPTKRTLNRLTESIHFKPGFNESVFDSVKEKVNTFHQKGIISYEHFLLLRFVPKIKISL